MKDLSKGTAFAEPGLTTDRKAIASTVKADVTGEAVKTVPDTVTIAVPPSPPVKKESAMMRLRRERRERKKVKTFLGLWL